MISVSNDLKKLIDEYNEKNPFEKLNFSQISQKAIFEKIKAENPELISKDSMIQKGAAAKPRKSLELMMEEEIAQADLEIKTETKTPEKKKTKKTAPKKNTSRRKPRDFDNCLACGKSLEGKRSDAQACSTKCKARFDRMSKEEQEELIKNEKERMSLKATETEL
jgi:hypothetical protein